MSSTKDLFTERILNWAMQIQQIPSPTFDEQRRAKFLYDQFLILGAKDVSNDENGNVYARIAGTGEKPPVIISAHLDTVFPIGTQLTLTRNENQIYGAGIGDNSLALAALLAVCLYFQDSNLQAHNFPGLASDIWLVANVGEEGLGDLKGMKAIVNRFGSKTQAYLVLEGMSLGQIYTRGLGVLRYRIHVHTRGGHSWVDYGSPSAIHEIAELLVKIKNLSVPAVPRSSLNVGVIQGGTSVNTIAADASLELDLRSESTQELFRMAEQVRVLVSEANRVGAQPIQVEAEVIGDRPTGEISLDHQLVKTTIDCFARNGIDVKMNIGSTDANVPLSRGYPAICIGLTTGGGSHTTGEYIDTQPVSLGFNILIDLIRSIVMM